MTKEELSVAEVIVIHNEILTILNFYHEETDERGNEDTILRTTNFDRRDGCQYFSWGYLERKEAEIVSRDEFPEHFL